MYSDVVHARHSFSRPPRINTPRFSERIPVVYQLSALGPVSWAQPTSALKCVFLESLSAAMGSCWQESLTALEGLLVRCLLGTNADPHATRFLSSSSSLSSPSISPPWARVTTACKAGTLSSSFSKAVFPTQGTEGPSSTNHNDKNITRGTTEYIAFCFSTWVVVTQSLLLFFKLCIPICSLAYAFHGKKIKLKNCQGWTSNISHVEICTWPFGE